MRIDYSRIRNLTGRQIESALLRDGFEFVRQVGSHRRYVHPHTRRRVTVSRSGGDTFPLPTLRSIIENQAKWDADDLVRLGLLQGRGR